MSNPIDIKSIKNDALKLAATNIDTTNGNKNGKLEAE